MVFLLLVLGMVLLMKGADLFVDGSASVARKLKVPSVIIGLTIVALGTSLPEASVSITAGLMGSNEIAISNIVGSNIFNTLVVVGTSAIITPFLMDKDILNRDLKINILVSILLSVFVLNGMLNRFEGIIFLVGLVLFILNLIRSAKKNRVEDEEVETLSGIKTLKLNVENGKVKTVRVNMGAPILECDKVPVKYDDEKMINKPVKVDGKTFNITCVSMGNPHAVTFINDTDNLEIEKIGPKFENNEIFLWTIA